ncbi:MAG: chitobiase/beta-hexosaminidase C-terminal domain-containing protein, partial [Fibrobacterota bacterium]
MTNTQNLRPAVFFLMLFLAGTAASFAAGDLEESNGNSEGYTLSPGPGTYRKTISVSINAPENAVIRYTLDGSVPDDLSLQYRGPIEIADTGKTEIRFYAVGLTGSQTGVFSALYRIDTLSPRIRVYPEIRTARKPVEISAFSSEPAAIYYTDDGTVPTVSSKLYFRRITVKDSANLKFIAVDSAGNKSGVYSAAFRIRPGAPVVRPSLRPGEYPEGSELRLIHPPDCRVFYKTAPEESYRPYTDHLTLKSGVNRYFYYAQTPSG